MFDTPKVLFATLLSIMLCLHSAPAKAVGDAGGGIDCKYDGQAHCTLNGQDIKATMGSNTPTKSGSIPQMEKCQGTAFPCMKDKDCITIEGGYKFHKTNCGSGGQEPSGGLGSAGCVELSDKDFETLKGMAGQQFKVAGPGGGKSGR